MIQFQNSILEAIGLSILSSLWLSIIVYIVLKGAFKLLPYTSSRVKHDLYLAGIVVQSLHFLFSLKPLLMIKTIAFHNSIDLTNYKVGLVERPMEILMPQPQYYATLSILGIIYVFGVAIALFKQLNDYFKVRKLKKSAKYPVSNEWMNCLVNLKEKLRIETRVQLCCSPNIDSIMVFGLIRPIILIPSAYVFQLSIEQIEYILAHELYHVKRKDYLIQLLISGMSVLLFFNPFTYLLIKEIRNERENDCDDAVIRLKRNPVHYSETLLQLANYRLNKNALSKPLYLNGSNNQLFNRIKRITNMKKLNDSNLLALFIPLAIFSCFTLISWSAISIDKKQFQVVHKPSIETNHINTTIQEIKPSSKSSLNIAKHNIPTKKMILQDTVNKNQPKQLDDFHKHLLLIRNAIDSIKLVYDFEKKDYRTVLKDLDTLNNKDWPKNKGMLKRQFEVIKKVMGSPTYKDEYSKMLKLGDGKVDGYYLNNN
jgi:beta-lactamase regulating signal transducer with metallopeptidase domain